MIMWGTPTFIGVLLASAVLLRRMPLMALAVTLAGSVAPSLAPPEQIPASSFQVVVACVAGLEVCYMAATRTRRVSLTAVAVAGAGLPILVLEFPLPDQLPNGHSGTPVPVITVLVPLVMIIAWLIGHSIRQARGRTELVRAQAAAQTAMAERLRIAREVQVEVAWLGSREPLPADIDLSAFRIIQEAVTNVVRHAGTDRCLVWIDQQDGQLVIGVTDSGRGAPASKISAAGTGYGITGMRERAALLGGDLSAGPRPDGGFRVAARLPVPVPTR